MPPHFFTVKPLISLKSASSHPFPKHRLLKPTLVPCSQAAVGADNAQASVTESAQAPGTQNASNSTKPEAKQSGDPWFPTDWDLILSQIKPTWTWHLQGWLSRVARVWLADLDGPKQTSPRPKWTKIDHFGPFWSCEYQNPVRNKGILTRMVVMTILDRFGPAHFPAVLRRLLRLRWAYHSGSTCELYKVTRVSDIASYKALHKMTCFGTNRYNFHLLHATREEGMNYTLAHRNRSDFCDLRLRCPSRTPEIARFPKQEKAMPHCDLRVRWKVASDLRFQAAISETKTPSFRGISGDLAQSTQKSLAIAIVRFWCAKNYTE